MRFLTSALAILLLFPIFNLSAGDLNQAEKYASLKKLTGIPLTFTENKGQWDEKVLFRSDANGAIMWFTSEGIVYQYCKSLPYPENTSRDPFTAKVERMKNHYDRLAIAVMKAEFINANPSPKITTSEPANYRRNFMFVLFCFIQI